MEKRTQPLPAKKLHKYVLGLVGVWLIFALTAAIACLRVCQDKKFAQEHLYLKSWTLEGKLEQPSDSKPDVHSVTNKPSQIAGKADRMVNQTSPTVEITDRDELARLNQKLYDQIAENLPKGIKFEQKLVYRVSVMEDGSIATYEPLDRAASDYVQQTPLPSLLKDKTSDGRINQAGAITQKPIANFEVVFTPEGVLEVGRY